MSDKAGYPPPDTDSAPPDRFPMDADLTVYWPMVRPEWEEARDG